MYPFFSITQDACITYASYSTFSKMPYHLLCKSLSVYNEKRSTLRYRKTTGSAQVSFAGTQFLTLANLFFFSLFSFSYSLASILERICRRICISIASIGALVNASAFHGRSTTFWTSTFRCLRTLFFIDDIISR